VLRASAQGNLPVSVDEVGSEWAKNYAIDVVGIGESSASLVLGDCYWQEEPVGVSALEALLQKTSTIVPKAKQPWSVYYVLFSASGWTSEAREQAENLIVEVQSNRRKRWQPVGIRLVDMDELDRDLIRWSA
jgi:hypothetical protein